MVCFRGEAIRQGGGAKSAVFSLSFAAETEPGGCTKETRLVRSLICSNKSHLAERERKRKKEKSKEKKHAEAGFCDSGRNCLAPGA